MEQPLTRLSPDFVELLGSPMRKLPVGSAPPFDFWSYVERIPVEEYEGHASDLGTVQYVYDEPSQRYLLVNLDTDDKNVFMVVVLDTQLGHVHGHFLLDLNQKYGLEEPTR